MRFVWFSLIWFGFIWFVVTHRLNMELDLQSLFGLHVHSCTHQLRTRNPPPPSFGLIYERAIGQPRCRRHLFVTPLSESYPSVQEVECRILGRSKTGQTVEIR
jgi:hypothetical protein